MNVMPQTGRKIGLTLGAGAARGWAHIGVVERLAEHGITPCAVTGSSIGALVGGLYAAGKLDALKRFALSLTRRRMYTLLDISWRGSGLFAGDKLGSLLEAELGGCNFEDLRTPFICIGTELSTGHELWLRSGPLATSIRASYALPGIFKPVRLGNHWLIDGGVVNPIPVSACRALGARIVIAVNLGPESMNGIVLQDPAVLPDIDNVGLAPGLTSVLIAAFNITQDRLSRSKLAGDPPDVNLTLRTSGLSLFDFAKADEAIAAGREAVDAAMPEIERALTFV